MNRRAPLGLAISALAHGALIAGVSLVVPRADRLPPLFVDLAQDLAIGGRRAPVPAPPKIGAARPAPSGKLASPAPAALRVLESPVPAEMPPLPPAARTAEPEDPLPARPSPPREGVASPPAAPLTPADTQPLATTPVIAPLPREETVSAPMAPPARAAAEATPPPPAIAPPPRVELTSAPAAVSAPSAPIASSLPSEPLPPAAAALVPADALAHASPVWGDAVPQALTAGQPGGLVGPGAGRADADARGETVTSDVPLGNDARDSLGAREGQSLALARSGTGSDDPAAAYGGYLAGLRQRIQETLRYPLPARRRGLTGTVTVELTVLPSGAIGPVAVVESSAHPLLDQAALETVQSLRAEPFPADLPPRTLRVRLPVVFQLR